jgi:pimeloyl-ACP methyl ester carboxylesterase
MMKRKLLGAVVATAAALAGLASSTPATAQEGGDPDVRPMIFVHGGLGSGSQFESQALRFASNGYPADMIEMFEHNSLEWPGSQDEVWSRLDRHIADMLDAHDAEQVYLLGHSQGTGVVQGYLNSDADRAADVARYVNLDGGSGGSVPDEVETLAIWGEPFAGGSAGTSGNLPGAENIQFENQGHTQVVNSPETFEAMFTFLTGTEPFTTGVVRDPSGQVEIGGRAQLFPANDGVTDARLEVWEVDGETGLRTDHEPVYAIDLEGDGGWGPVEVSADGFYEFAISRESGTHHIHLQQFVRDNPWIRLLTSEPGGLADSFWETGDGHMNLVIFRNKEFWGDQGADGDSLTINGDEILNDATSPRSNRTIGIFVHDDGVDGQSDLSAPVQPHGVTFLTGVNLYIPAASPPDGTVAVEAAPRLGSGREAVCVPNWASSADRVSIQLNAYHHVVDESGRPVAGPAAPDCAPAADRPDQPAAPAAPGAGATPPAPAVGGTPDLTG